MPPLHSLKEKRIEAIKMALWKKTTPECIEDRLRRLEMKCDDLERAKKGLDMEFTELYDKVSHQMSRMAKRYARAEKLNGEEQPKIPDNEISDGIDPISKSILARRARLGKQM